MSSVTVLCPNGHRVKVSTNPNMSLQAVMETAANKKGFDPSIHVLEFHKKRLDMSSTVRFSGIPNNATLEMERLSDDEIERLASKEVSVCLQVPGGERLMADFPTTASLGSVLDKWCDKLGAGEEGEEPVIVFMRREVVGRQQLDQVTLSNLGLLQGKGLFRFFYKKPEELKVQANVYEMKEKEKVVPADVPHVPMRLNPDNKVVTEPAPAENEPMDDSGEEVETVITDEKTTSQQPAPGVSSVGEPDKPSVNMTADDDDDDVSPDSTQPEPVVNLVGPNEAVIFSALDANPQYQDIDDDFFELSLDEVKTMYRDLRSEVKRLTEGEMLMTKEMRESQAEGEKLSMLSKYKSCVLRIQFPSRHVVQGIFGPDTKISEVLTWLSPILASPNTPHELYTAPPRTSLPPDSSLMDLNLFPAALVHFASLVTRSEPVNHLAGEALDNLSNVQGANNVASQARRRSGQSSSSSQRVTEDEDFRQPSRPGKRSNNDRAEPLHNYQPSSSSSQQQSASKVPKWFKPSKK